MIRTIQNKSCLMLDSGAFSAWNRGAIINIDEYISFCLMNMDKVDYVVNLDVIPGSPFNPPTKKEREESAKAGWKNYKKMLSAGIPREKLIHVFHQGEDFYWLEKIANEIPYIGISPANDKTTKQKLLWLDDCMKYVLDDNKKPIVKFHGFAVTSLKLVFNYPWYSIDSSSWQLIAGGFGKIFTPQMIGSKDKPEYWHNIQTPIGRGVQDYNEKANQDKGFFDDLQRKTQSELSFANKKFKTQCTELLESYNFNLDKLETVMHLRSAWNAIYLIETISKFTNTKLFLAGNNIKAFKYLLHKMKENNLDLDKVNVLTSYALLGKSKKGTNLTFLEKINNLIKQ